jgi:2-oxoacid:acceptor oxidoreductase gamma subunit (pyruvate/2-ketoisovalerate family)
MSVTPSNQAHEIRWHGRGGQGAVTSAKVLANAAFRAGFAGVTSAPSFGAERRGAPVTASTRLDDRPIRVYSQVTKPDIVVVLDESLLDVGGASVGLVSGGSVIVNTTRSASELGLPAGTHVFTADVTGASEAAGVVVGGTPMVSGAILGSVAKATGLISLADIEAAIADAFSPKAAASNFEAAKIAFECTKEAIA